MLGASWWTATGRVGGALRVDLACNGAELCVLMLGVGGQLEGVLAVPHVKLNFACSGAELCMLMLGAGGQLEGVLAVQSELSLLAAAQSYAC